MSRPGSDNGGFIIDEHYVSMMGIGELTERLRETLDVFEQSGDPGAPMTTNEVTECLDVSRRSTYARLERLVDRGLLETKKVGARGRIWWCSAETISVNATSGGGIPSPLPSESLVDDVIDAVDVGVLVLDASHEVASANDTIERFFGIDRTSIVGRDGRDVVRDRMAPILDDSTAFVETVLETDSDDTSHEPFEFRIPPGTDRSERWLERQSESIESDPFAGGRVELFYDVTDRKRSQQEATHQRGDFRTDLDDVLERIGDAFYAVDDEFRFTYVNDRAEELLRHTEEELLGKSVWDVFPEATETDAWESFHEALEQQEPTSYELYFEPLEFWVEANVYPSQTGLSVYFRDVTERKARERELRESEEVLRTLAEGQEDIVWITSADPTDFLYINSAYEEAFETEREELYEDGLAFVDAIHPDDRERVHGAYTALPERDYDEEYRVVHPDGTTRWLRAQATPVRDEDGEIYRTVGIATDVTEEKARKRELEQYETAARIASDVFVAIDDESRIRTVNPAVEEVFGYAPDELIGESLTMLMPDRFVEVHRAGVVDYLETGERQLDWDYIELPGAHADGDEIPLAISFSEYEHDGDHYFTGIIRDITERKERERELERRHEELAALNNLNEVVREISYAVVEQSTREEIEEIVCERLADTESYQFAWICDVDPRTTSINPRVEAGVDGYVDDVSISTDPDDPAGQGPAGRAIRTKEMQTVRDVFEDPTFEQWRDAADEYGFRSLAAIPIVHGDTLYGLLTVYSDRAHAFDGQERTVISQLGETVGHAIAAVERKRALMSDEVVELEFHVPNVFNTFGVDAAADGTITFDEIVLIGNDDYLVYGTATADAADTLSAITEAVPHWEDVTCHDDAGDTSFELRLSDPPLLTEFASRGGSLEDSVIEDGDHHMTLHLPPSVSVRQIMDAAREAYPTAEIVSRRQVTRTDDLGARIERVLAEELTDRQHAALQAAYRAGFFEWPRDTSGEEVADSLDVSSPTFHQHLRKAEKKVFESLLSPSG